MADTWHIGPHIKWAQVQKCHTAHTWQTSPRVPSVILAQHDICVNYSIYVQFVDDTGIISIVFNSSHSAKCILD